MSEASAAEAQETAPDKPKRKQPAWLVGMAPKLDAPWRDIRDAVAAGISMSKVAKQFAEYHPEGHEALHEAIRKRAQREKWFVPASAMAKAREKLAEKGVNVPLASQSCKESHSDPVEVGTLILDNLEEMGRTGSLIAGQLNLALLKDAARAPHKLAPLVDVKDIATSVKTLRMVAGMDKPAPAVSLNLWSGHHVPARDVGTSSVTHGQPQGIGEWSDLDGESE